MIGKLHVILSNQVIPADDPKFMKSRSKNRQPNQKKHRYKHVKSKPLSLAQVGEGSFQEHLKTYVETNETQYDNQARLQLRIEKMKKRKMQKAAQETSEANVVKDWERRTVLNHISFIRDQDKDKIFENVIKNQD